MNEVLAHIVDSISPASAAQAAGATQRLLRAQVAAENGSLAELATRLCAARHNPAPTLENKVAVVVAADHGVADPGIELGESNPTLMALQLMAEGGAAINSAARSADAQLVFVDAGIRGAGQLELDSSILSFRMGDGTEDMQSKAAMSAEEAAASIQTGIALCFSLADAGLDLLALGQVSSGSQPVSAALVAALTRHAPEELSPADAELLRSIMERHQPRLAKPIDALALVGGYELGVLTGLILAAASIHVPVLLDGHGTSAAALLASRINPSVRGYLFASHSGGIPAHARALEELGLSPLFAVGLAQGEGTAAVLAIPMLEAAARVLRELP